MALNLDLIQTKCRSLPEITMAFYRQGGSGEGDCVRRPRLPCPHLCRPFFSLVPALPPRPGIWRWKPLDQGLALPPQVEPFWARF